jgi:hypothetical protein
LPRPEAALLRNKSALDKNGTCPAAVRTRSLVAQASSNSTREDVDAVRLDADHEDLVRRREQFLVRSRFSEAERDQRPS